jgi:hypothetical protein
MRPDTFYQIPTAKILPNGITIYDQHRHRRRTGARSLFYDPRDHSEEPPGQIRPEAFGNAYSSEITTGSRKRMSACIDLLLAASKLKTVAHPVTCEPIRFRINFITLTLAAYQGDITDREIKQECLKPWLREMRERYHLNSYVWKAEQQKNQNIHFHLVTDTWIHHTELRECWNRMQNRLGFVDRFEALHGHRYPNSTDVHAVHKVKEARNDLIKYITKHETTGSRDMGKLWDASLNLKWAKMPIREVDRETDQLLNKYLDANPDAMTAKQFMTWIHMPDRVKRGNLPADFLEQYKQVLLKIRAGVY